MLADNEIAYLIFKNMYNCLRDMKYLLIKYLFT